ncbi:MAG TPA: Os1348 family NHLP clan protein [Candidatus Limnocylindria bacterium]
MSKNLEKVIQRAISDAAFRRQLQSNPEAALRGFNLTGDEVAALRSGDAGKLMSLGIDQRMSKTFQVGGESFSSMASRAAIGGDLTTTSGSLIDQDTGRLAAADTIGATSGSTASIDPGNVDGTPRAFGDPLSTATAASDALEDQSHAIAGRQMGDATGTVRSSVRDFEPAAQIGTSDYSSAYPAHGGLAGPSGTNLSAGNVAPVEGSPEAFAFRDQGETAVRSNVRDFEPAAGSAPTSDAIEDQSHAIAGRLAGETAVRSNVRDFEPAAQLSNSEVASDEGQVISRIRDNAPADVGSSATISGDDAAGPGYLAASDDMTISRVRDIAPADTMGSDVAASSAATSDAFLTEGEVSQYAATDPNWSSDAAEDTSHAFNPDVSDAAVDGGTDSTANHDSELTS